MANEMKFKSSFIDFSEVLNKFVLLLVTCVVMTSVPAAAQGNAITSIVGGSPFSGDWVLGYRFTVNSSVIVDELGILEQSGNLTLDNSQPASVGLWTASGTLLSEASVPETTPLSGNGYYVPVAPVVLTPGSYVIAINVFATGEPVLSNASVVMAPELAFEQAVYEFTTTLVFPTASDGIVWDEGFFGGSFNFILPAADSDVDGDGVLDTDDAFPNDPTETMDTDGDGVGDNSDAFPEDATETQDTDSDGVGDNTDAFPFDPTETTDTDGDGIGDNTDPDPLVPEVEENVPMLPFWAYLILVLGFLYSFRYR